ncbi:SusD/RagB family nutrient-binding outer membrane lipoprotein [Danxiaibacter flavus]|uniref:SusD/RagB family nutrient-binding outer membrane lipoprotein n=1 Tax=Danxiaibacter flavus TaxID=3049108 RepID=A0ABV3ZFF3_9BACT|nr:SusD/RagB family nutrient-binding outer membrane lipoprotein [Chitinophagaceae bacterium DXS]
MKKILLSITTIALAAGSFISCKKSDFDSKYYNPDKSTGANISSLFSGLYRNRTVLPRYWNLYTFVVPYLGKNTQTVGYVNGQRMYDQPLNYISDRWDAFYISSGSTANDQYSGPVSQYREIEKAYNTYSTAGDKAGYRPFVEASRIFLYDQAIQMVDFFGDIPFSQAGMINATGDAVKPKFDDASGLYDSVLTELQRINNYFDTANVSSFYTNQFTQADIALHGSFSAWRKYANSLRLRLAMRISYVNEAKAKAIVTEMLGNPAKYPLIDNVTENVQITAAKPNLNAMNDIRDGLGNNPAPGYMLDSLMKPSGDPRLRVYFTKNKRDNDFHGMPVNWDGGRQNDSIGKYYFSYIDSVTFVMNNYFPGIILTASEVSFCKAEAFERWGGGDAKQSYENGIRQSVQYYYNINALNTEFGSPATPATATEIAGLLASPLVSYDGGTKDDRLKKIAIQKWVDFGIIRADQAWAEMRRTKYPSLYFAPEPSASTLKVPAFRLLYPSREKLYNTDNYSAVEKQDQPYTKIFWDVR